MTKRVNLGVKSCSNAHVSQCGWLLPECLSASATGKARRQPKSPHHHSLERNIPFPNTKHNSTLHSHESNWFEHAAPSRIPDNVESRRCDIAERNDPHKSGTVTCNSHPERRYQSRKYDSAIGQSATRSQAECHAVCTLSSIILTLKILNYIFASSYRCLISLKISVYATIVCTFQS